MLLLSLLFACNSSTPGDDTSDPGGEATALPGTTIQGDAQRVSSPSTADLPTLTAENGDFAVALTRELLGGDPANLVVSPWSLQMVMAQVYAGASGDAKTAIGDTFGWSLAEPQLHEAFDAADLALEAHHDQAAEPPVSITDISQIFVTTGYPLGEPWLDTLSAYYGTGVQEMDFAADPAGVADDINAWILSNTGGHIDDLITPAMVGDSRMLLVNALFFKASWAVPFSEEHTEDASFTLLDGSTISVPTMMGSVSVSGVQRDGWLYGEMPFSDTALTITLVVPDAGRFAEVAGALTWADLVEAEAAAIACEQCTVHLPRFTIDAAPDVQAAMTAMGMGPAFSGTYAGINPDLTLTGVDQQAFILTNEIGTEAAAATVAEFSDSAPKDTPPPIIADRPFLYFVRDATSGAVLFSGAVVDPR